MPFITKRRLHQTDAQIQCVDVVECRHSKQLLVDKHTDMTLNRHVSNRAIKELDLLLQLQPKKQKHHAVGAAHIIRYHTHQLIGTRLHVLQEYCGRGDLFSVLQHESRMQKAGLLSASDCLCGSEARLRAMFYQIASGIAYCHSRNIVHLDLSLENVLLTDQNVIKLADFEHGARICAETGYPIDHVEHGVAKCAYAAPEMHASDLSHSDLRKADAWSLGILLWKLWTKRTLVHTATLDDPFYCMMLEIGTLRALQQQTTVSASAGLWDLMRRLVDPNPSTRLSVDDALQHPWLLSSSSASRRRRDRSVSVGSSMVQIAAIAT